MPKPTTLPRFAEYDLVDPTSGVNNVLTPPVGIQDYGYNPAGVFPKRQHDNWFKRWVYNWLQWLDGELHDEIQYLRYVSTISVETHPSDISPQSVFELNCVRNIKTINGVPQDDELIFMSVPEIQGTSTSSSLRLRPENWPPPGGEWPTWFINGFQQGYTPFIVIDNGLIRMGTIEFPENNGDFFNTRVPDASGDLQYSNYTASGNKGFVSQTVTVRNAALAAPPPP